MMLKDKKMKYIEKSELFLRVKTEEFTDRFGRKVVESKWIKARGDVNLGSCSKPNPLILEFKYNVPDDKSILEKLFGDK